MSHLVLTLHSKTEWQKEKTVTFLTQPDPSCFRKMCLNPLEAVLTAAHLINRLPSRILGFKSPMDILSTFYPNLHTTNNLVPRIFGCVAFVHVHNQNRGKLDPRALKCVFVGYSSTQKGYKCYHPP